MKNSRHAWICKRFLHLCAPPLSWGRILPIVSTIMTAARKTQDEEKRAQDRRMENYKGEGKYERQMGMGNAKKADSKKKENMHRNLQKSHLVT